MQLQLKLEIALSRLIIEEYCLKIKKNNINYSVYKIHGRCIMQQFKTPVDTLYL